MKKNVLILLLIASALVIVSCEKDKTDLPIEYKFVLLDTLGNEKTAFNQGENIIFSFQIINKGSEDLYLEKFLPNDEFFRVYNLNTDEGTLDYGVPYTGFTLSAGYFVYENDTLKIKYPWNNINSENATNTILFGNNKRPNLSIGSFTTSFSQSFTFGNNIKTEEKHFEINFTIK